MDILYDAKNYSVSYDADEDDVGQLGSSEADSETTFGYSTRETLTLTFLTLTLAYLSLP